jgi:hypothetical protein
MRQGIQTGFKNADLRGWGCYFFTLCEMAERLRNKPLVNSIASGGKPFEFSDDDVISAYNHCLKQGWVFTGIQDGRRITCWIKNPVAILNYLQGTIHFTKASHEKNQPNAEFYPVFFDGTPTHFALGANGKVIWDSWLPSAESRGMKFAVPKPFRWLR